MPSIFYTFHGGAHITTLRPTAQLAERRTAREANDCTVIALSVAAQVPYDVAHKALADAGRKSRRGVKLAVLIPAGKIKGFTFRRVQHRDDGGISVKRFCEKFPTGRFIVRKAQHAFAIIEGIPWDHTARKPLERITDAWEVVQ